MNTWVRFVSPIIYFVLYLYNICHFKLFVTCIDWYRIYIYILEQFENHATITDNNTSLIIKLLKTFI